MKYIIMILTITMLILTQGLVADTPKEHSPLCSCCTKHVPVTIGAKQNHGQNPRLRHSPNCSCCNKTVDSILDTRTNGKD